MSLLLLFRGATEVRRARVRVSAGLVATVGVGAARIPGMTAAAVPAASLSVGAARVGASLSVAADTLGTVEGGAE